MRTQWMAWRLSPIFNSMTYDDDLIASVPKIKENTAYISQSLCPFRSECSTKLFNKSSDENKNYFAPSFLSPSRCSSQYSLSSSILLFPLPRHFYREYCSQDGLAAEPQILPNTCFLNNPEAVPRPCAMRAAGGQSVTSRTVPHSSPGSVNFECTCFGTVT